MDKRRIIIKKKNDCGICYTKNVLRKLVCGHEFCEGCCENWIVKNKQNTCPICRKIVLDYRITPERMEKYLEKVYNHLTSHRVLWDLELLRRKGRITKINNQIPKDYEDLKEIASKGFKKAIYQIYEECNDPNLSDYEIITNMDEMIDKCYRNTEKNEEGLNSYYRPINRYIDVFEGY